ncbi:MAG: hypothetical protein AAFV25_19365 [Bacteroidota bacterium]
MSWSLVGRKMETIISQLAFFNWTLGIVLMLFSNASGIISKTDYQ